MDPTIPLAPVRAFAELPYVDDATELLAAAPIGAVAFGLVPVAYVIGADAEAEMISRLQERAHGLPVVATCAAAVSALRLLRASRMMLVDGGGVRCCVLWLPSDQRAITPAALHDWILRHAPDRADAIVIGGNGFRAVGVVAALEDALGRPVLTANQVLLWAALRAAGSDPSMVTRYGRIFTVT